MRIMIDTVGFKAQINYETYHKIREKTLMTQRIDKETGAVEFEYDNGQTNHSDNYRIVYKISDEYWTYDRSEDSNGEVQKSRKCQAIKIAGIPHVKLEFSIPKILFGHNLHSVSIAIIFDAMYLVKRAFEEKYECILPSMHKWFCYRIDTCANYILNNEQEVRNYISYLSKLDYPRREPIKYGDSGIYFPSQQNTLKVYAKGPEFKKHDKNRFLDSDKAYLFYAEAKNILRIEVEHKRRIRYLTKKYNSQFDNLPDDRKEEMYVQYLKHQIDRLNEANLLPDAIPKEIDRELAQIDRKLLGIDDRSMMYSREPAPEETRMKTFEGYPQIMNLISIFDCKSEMKNIMENLLSGTPSKVTQSLAVENLIREHCTKKQASTFIAVYYSIINQGQAYAKKEYERNIYYRALAAYRIIGISLIADDTNRKSSTDCGFPEDFRLDMDESNPYYQKPLLSMEEVLENKRKWIDLINIKKLEVYTAEKAFRDYCDSHTLLI